MKIALVGYGKMGKSIEEIAKKRGHEIVLRISIDNPEALTADNLREADVAIEFTGPESAFYHVQICLLAGVPTVCGSTGWNENIAEAENLCVQKDGSFLYASNFSVGMNIFFELNRKLAEMMAHHPEYDISMKEIHHTQKKDAPSGTAITLAEDILMHSRVKQQWSKVLSGLREDLVIESERLDPEPGTHHVRYHSDVDDIEIIHKAHNRSGFAMGAILAAEYIKDKKGVFNMKQVLGL
jgi:4-hydroxy-tetrahydrodipicolinate reductase